MCLPRKIKDYLSQGENERKQADLQLSLLDTQREMPFIAVPL